MRCLPRLCLGLVLATLGRTAVANPATGSSEPAKRAPFEPYAIVLKQGPNAMLAVTINNAPFAITKLPAALPRDAEITITIKGQSADTVLISLPRGRREFGATGTINAVDLNKTIQASGARDTVYPAMKHFLLGGVSRAGGAKDALVYPTADVFVRAEAWRMVFPPAWPGDADTALMLGTGTGAEIARAVVRVPASGVVQAPAAWAPLLAGHPGASLKVSATASGQSASAAFTLLASEAATALDQRLATADTEPDPVLRQVARAHAYELAGMPLESTQALAEAVRLDQPARYPALRDVVTATAARHGLGALLAP